MFRRYSKTLGLILVAVILKVGEFAVELLAPKVQEAFEKHPWYQPVLTGVLGFCTLAAIFLFILEHNAPTEEASDKPRSPYEAERDLENRKAMLGLVRRHWVEGVLHKSLWNEVRLILNLEAPPTPSRAPATSPSAAPGCRIRPFRPAPQSSTSTAASRASCCSWAPPVRAKPPCCWRSPRP